tara:strand:+ start:1660 stop:2100 length:441 start_codon:yes stop_codon:yes gene_type:complete
LGFKEDLQRGVAVEDDLLRRLRLSFPNAKRAEGLHPEFDIEIPELHKTVEVKYDPMSQKTGNIVIEYFHRKPSAFSVSSADYWVIDTGKKEMWFSRKGILNCILSEGLEPVCFKGTTDRYSKWAFLIPLHLLQRYSNAVLAEQHEA